MYRTVLVPVDESPESERAVPFASQLADVGDLDVEFVSVDSARVNTFELACYHRRLIDELPPGVNGRSSVATTDASVAAELARRASRPDALLCIATHARGPVGEVLLGSIGDATVRASTQPILLVGPRCDAAAVDALAETAVVAVACSPADDAVMRTATRWAELVGTDLVIAHVATTPSNRGALEAAETELHRLVGVAEDRGVSARCSLLQAGDAGRALLHLHAGIGGILVVGSHRRGPVGRVVQGSHALWLAHRAPSPVLIAEDAADDEVDAPVPSRTDVSLTCDHWRDRDPAPSW